MKIEKSVASSTGTFKWNMGGWFGSLFGGTVFLAIGSVTSSSLWSAGVWLGCFLVCWAAGVFLWRHRSEIGAYPAIQILLLIIGLCAVIAVGSASLTGETPSVFENEDSWSDFVSVLVLIPALMLLMCLIETVGQRKKRRMELETADSKSLDSKSSADPAR